jgi:hypothetical protein
MSNVFIDGYSEFVGSFPVRQELTVLPADKPRDNHSHLHRIVINARGKAQIRRKPGALGWTVTEKIGVAIINPRALKSLKKSVIIGE